MSFSQNVVHDRYTWFHTLIYYVFLVIGIYMYVSPPPGRKHATFSDKEVLPLHEHYCCQPQLCMADGNWRVSRQADFVLLELSEWHNEAKASTQCMLMRFCWFQWLFYSMLCCFPCTGTHTHTSTNMYMY